HVVRELVARLEIYAGGDSCQRQSQFRLLVRSALAESGAVGLELCPHVRVWIVAGRLVVPAPSPAGGGLRDRPAVSARLDGAVGLGRDAAFGSVELLVALVEADHARVEDDVRVDDLAGEWVGP